VLAIDDIWCDVLRLPPGIVENENIVGCYAKYNEYGDNLKRTKVSNLEDSFRYNHRKWETSQYQSNTNKGQKA